jgi:hypothetical protein
MLDVILLGRDRVGQAMMALVAQLLVWPWAGSMENVWNITHTHT